MPVNLKDLSLVYEGSVKRVWSPAEKEDKLWFEFTDDYSVFDWGKMPDIIANKGRSLVILGAYLFEELSKPELWQQLPKSSHLKQIDHEWLQARWEHPVFADLLSESGAPSHYKQLVTSSGRSISRQAAAESAASVYLEVLPAEVNRPEPFVLASQTVYYYPRKTNTPARRLIPLEVVFRFGMPSGSSLQTRLEKDPSYAHTLGLAKVPQPGKMFPHPVIEFYTKLEPKDRLLSLQEALLLSGLSPERFEDLIEYAYDLALGLYTIFAARGIELWDGKFEFVTGREGILLVDSIGPDELRLLYKGQHLSKEMIRQHYRGGSWETALKKAQQLSTAAGNENWKQICIEQLKEQPARLPAEFKALADSLYPTITNHVVGEKLFVNQPSIDEFVEKLPKHKP